MQGCANCSFLMMKKPAKMVPLDCRR